MSKTKSGQVIDLRQHAEKNGVCPATRRDPVRHNHPEFVGLAVPPSREPLFLPTIVVVELDVQRIFAPRSVSEFFMRHITGDWGNLDEDRRCENAIALEASVEVVSEFKVHGGLLLCFVTSGDRVTTMITLIADDA